MSKPCSKSSCVSFKNCNEYNFHKDQCKDYTPDEFKIDKDEAIEIDKKAAESAGFDYDEWRKLMHQPVVVKSIQEDIEKDIMDYIKNKYGDYFEIKEFPKENDKHLKGYIFDSLVLRYKYALELGTGARADEIMATRNNSLSRKEAIAKARDLNGRDLMIFIKILNEAIGEHD